MTTANPKIGTKSTYKPVPNGGKGRPKGAKNKTTTLLKDAILMAAEAYEDGGLVGYLTFQSTANPTAYLTLLGKVMPTQVTGEDGDAIKQSLTILTGVPRPNANG